MNQDLPCIQEHYPQEFNHCYGCGRHNEKGLAIESYWDGEEAVCRFEPRPEHHAMPGVIYGGLIASLIDCHSIGTACAALNQAAGRKLGETLLPRCVTASLTVDYLSPTPENHELVLRARAEEVGERKVIVSCTLEAAGEVTARGRVIAVRLPDSDPPS